MLKMTENEPRLQTQIYKCSKQMTENKSLESTPRTSSIPQQEATGIAVNGHRTSSRNRLTSSGSNHDEDDLKIKKTANKDHYVPSWLKSTDLREKSPSTPNMAYGKPTKDTSEVPQWMRELREKRKERTDSDTGLSTKRTQSAADKGLIPWKVKLGQKEMRQAPVKVRDHYVPSSLRSTDLREKSPSTPNVGYVTPTKDTSEVPQWKRELREKRKERKDSDTGLSTKRTESAAEKGLPPWKVNLGQKEMRQTPVKVRDHYVPSSLRSTDLREKSPSTPNVVDVTPTKDTSEVPQWKRELREKRKERKDSDTGLSTKRTESAAEKGLPPWKVNLGQKEMRQTPVKVRDHYVPSSLRSTDLREKSPSTPNVVDVTPTKDTSEVPQWKRELREKRKERKDSDTGLSTKRTESAAEKGLPPWKVNLGQKEMRQTPVKVRDHYVPSSLRSTDLWEKSPSTPNVVDVTPTKDTSEVPQWKRELREKRKERKDSDTGLSTKRTESAAEKGLPPWKVNLGQKEMRQTPVKVRDHYVPSSLRSTDLWEKSPSTPNVVDVTPTKDTSEVPQWKRELREKRKERKDSDTGLSTKRTESAAEKGLPPWKVNLGQKEMRQTPVKVRDHYVPSSLRSTDLREKSPSTPNVVDVTPTKDTSEVPQWKRELREKRKERKDSDTGLSTKRTESAAEKGLPPWKVNLGQKEMRQTPVKVRDHYVPSSLRSTDLREKSPSTPNVVDVTPTKDTSEVPQWKRELREKRKERKDSDTGLSTKRTESAAEKGLPPWKVNLGQKEMRQTPVKVRDHYVPSSLRSTDLREKSPSTPNVVYVTPTKDTSEVPQWKRELREKRKERKDSDTGLSTKRTESAAEKGLPPWKVNLGQKEMRQTPVKVRDHYVPSSLRSTDLREKSPSTPNVVYVTPTKDTSEVPQWKRELREKRKERKDSDTGLSTKRTGSAAELLPWKVALGQKKMRQTPVKGNLSSPENEPTLSQVEINFSRIVNLLTTICPSAVRVYFDQQIPPNELKTFVDLEKNNKILENLQKRRIITQVQWMLLYPSDGTDPSSSKFDVTLMVAILRNLTGMRVYDGPPSTYQNLTESTSVSTIKYYRNQIVHSSNGRLSDNEFNIIFDEIVKAIEKLCPAMKSKCDLLRNRELDRSFIEVCQELINKENEYEVIRKEQTAIQADHKLLQNEHTTLQADYLSLKKEQEHVASQLPFIKSNQDEIKHWEEEDKTFVKTKNVDSIIKVLQRENGVTVFGKSGMGKSATIHHIALHFQNTHGYTITPCKSPAHIKHVWNKRQIFVIDDMCGKYKIRQNEIEEWLNLNWLKFSDKFIVSCRSEIFRHPKFQILEQFVKLSFELSYCKEDHLEIAAKYLKPENIEQLNNVVDISHFTPLLFVLYSRNPNSNLSEFFDSPFKIYTQEWNLLAQLNATQFCVLFLCMLYNGCIDMSSFSSEFRNTESRLKLENIFEQCGIERGTSSQKIIAQLNCLKGSYVELKDERYVLIHDTLLDFLCCYFGEKFPEIVIKYADKQIIFERIQLKSLSACHETYIINISEKLEREYFQRISKEILNGNIIKALDSPQMQYEQYQVKMVHILQHLDKQKLTDLMMRRTDDFTISEPLFLACSRGYDPIMSLFIDKGADINQQNSCGYTPLITASFNGQKKTVLSLINKGADINKCDYDKWTPLKFACGKGFKNIVQVLIANGASVDEVYEGCISPLEIVEMHQHNDIEKLLLLSGAKKITRCPRIGNNRASIKGNFQRYRQVPRQSR